MGKNFSDFKHIVVFCGAGLSAESGVPTYRGKGGVWEQYDYEEYACQAAFDRNPQKVWDFQNKRRSAVADCDPNLAHLIIARMQKEHPKVTIVTQNIDGLQTLAGAQKVIELHGSLWRVRRPSTGEVFDLREPIIVDSPRFANSDEWMRPDIVWFGDNLDNRRLYEAVDAIKDCDLFLSIGTSGVVYPAAALPQIAMQHGATRIEINPEETPMSALYDLCIRSPASQAMQELWELEDWTDILA